MKMINVCPIAIGTGEFRDLKINNSGVMSFGSPTSAMRILPFENVIVPLGRILDPVREMIKEEDE